ncbi:MAG: hypothetical protein ACREKL_03200, partial [Chthoniobacterales bacterium]
LGNLRDPVEGATTAHTPVHKGAIYDFCNRLSNYLEIFRAVVALNKNSPDPLVISLLTAKTRRGSPLRGIPFS